jgi:hypothetical protein
MFADSVFLYMYLTDTYRLILIIKYNFERLKIHYCLHAVIWQMSATIFFQRRFVTDVILKLMLKRSYHFLCNEVSKQNLTVLEDLLVAHSYIENSMTGRRFIECRLSLLILFIIFHDCFGKIQHLFSLLFLVIVQYSNKMEI